jgi:hypothetical protein
VNKGFDNSAFNHSYFDFEAFQGVTGGLLSFETVTNSNGMEFNTHSGLVAQT